MTKPLRLGIAGYGVVGKRRRFFADQRDDIRTVAVCDRTFAEPTTLPDGVRAYTRYQDLLSKEDLDVLFVCMTNDIAPQATMAGLDAGLHVLCEKPPGRDLHDIAAVFRHAQAYPHLKLKYGFNHRYHESVIDARRMIESGAMGELINLRGVYGKSSIVSFESDWRTKRAIAGGGILLDQGIHMVDLMRLFAGEFRDIKSFVSNSHWGHDVEDNAYAVMRTDGGVIAMLHSSATQWRHRFSLDMAFEKGTLILSGILSGSKSYGAETLTLAWNTSSGTGDPREQMTRYNHDPSWAAEIAELLDAIRWNRPIEIGSPLDALRTMHLVYRIYCADPEWRARWNLDDTVPTLDAP